jgi:hypothetical protein
MMEGVAAAVVWGRVVGGARLRADIIAAVQIRVTLATITAAGARAQNGTSPSPNRAADQKDDHDRGYHGPDKIVSSYFCVSLLFIFCWPNRRLPKVPVIPENNVEETGRGDRRPVYWGRVNIVAAAPSAAFFRWCTAKIIQSKWTRLLSGMSSHCFIKK